MKHIAIFASGNGTNAENLIRYFSVHTDSNKINLVICNKVNAGVIERANRLKVPVEIINSETLNKESDILALLKRYSIDTIVLAGFLLMIPSFLIDKYRGRIINIHPSLLPAYGGKGMYGHRVHEAVIAAGEKESGITIHQVSEIYDDGEIIFQARVSIEADDTPEILESKIHNLEKMHFPRIVAELP